MTGLDYQTNPFERSSDANLLRGRRSDRFLLRFLALILFLRIRVLLSNIVPLLSLLVNSSKDGSILEVLVVLVLGILVVGRSGSSAFVVDGGSDGRSGGSELFGVDDNRGEMWSDQYGAMAR